MAFVSVAFLVFVAVVALAYFLCPISHRWKVLLVASYSYFWINSKWLLLFMFAATVVSYYIANKIQQINENSKQYIRTHPEMTAPQKKAWKDQTKKKTKQILKVGIFFDFGILIVLKYFNFFADISSQVLDCFGIVIPQVKWLLPIGISFYTLQAVSYMTDVYRGKCDADQSLGRFMLFMSFFPQIVQGPIPRYSQLAHQLYEGHSFDYKRFTFGIQLILWGFMKKLIIAERVAVPTNMIFDQYQDYNGVTILLGAIFYGLQVYTDFSGGMDIAQGVSQIFGIELTLNFRQPYFSKSIEEFWRRWHITLGAWMREYVFYPLSLSKSFGKLSKRARRLFGQFFGKRLPAFLAMFIVYFLVGFWHGPNWKYVAYGVWNGIFIVCGILLEEVYEKTRNRLSIAEVSLSWRIFQIGRTFLLVSVGRFFSRAETLTDALEMFKRMFERWYDISPLINGSLTKLGLDHANWVVLMVAIAVLFSVDYLHERGVKIREGIAHQNIFFRWIIYYAAILLVVIFGMYGPGYDSSKFIYAQF